MNHVFLQRNQISNCYKINGLYCEDFGRSKREQRMLEDQQESRFQQFSRNRNLISLRDDSETHRIAVDARKLKLDKLKEKKEKLRKWKDKKEMQKTL
jgi:hypothetical protein